MNDGIHSVRLRSGKLVSLGAWIAKALVARGNNVAAFAAAAALNEATPHTLRIGGDTISARDIARAMSEMTGG